MMSKRTAPSSPGAKKIRADKVVAAVKGFRPPLPSRGGSFVLPRPESAQAAAQTDVGPDAVQEKEL